MKWHQICLLIGEEEKTAVELNLWFLERCLYLHLTWSLKSSLFQTVVWFNTLCWHFSAQGLDFSAHTGPVLLHNLYLRWLMSQAWKSMCSLENKLSPFFMPSLIPFSFLSLFFSLLPPLSLLFSSLYLEVSKASYLLLILFLDVFNLHKFFSR